MNALPYIGRFAPSPSGPLHAGSLVTAMASYLDAKVHRGTWLVRMEDIDEGRTVDGAADSILQALICLGLQWDGEVIIQSQRKQRYAQAFDQLKNNTYPCACTRREIQDSRTNPLSDNAPIYAGTCRNGMPLGKPMRSLRMRVPAPTEKEDFICFTDRFLGLQTHRLSHETGDFILKRADGYWAYQLAVVVDDADQGVTHIVRGADILESTARQIYLQRCLSYPTPSYCHVPLVTAPTGEKLSKQNGAPPLDLHRPLDELQAAATFLGLTLGPCQTISEFWSQAVAQWANRCHL
jgi:glutamyl-Q tRNA(Asp) synthetase